MDYDFNKDQELLKNVARDFLSKECKPLFVREMEEDPRGITPQLWQKMAELGWMGLIFPEKYGGIGGNYLDLIVLLIEMGYFCLPGPFFSTVVLGGMTILESETGQKRQELLTGIAEGKLFVPDAHISNYIICVARTKEDENKEDGITLFIVDSKSNGLEITPLETFAGDKMGEVVFSNVKVSKDCILGE